MLPLAPFSQLLDGLRTCTSLSEIESEVERCALAASSYRDWEALFDALPPAFRDVDRLMLAARAAQWSEAQRDTGGIRVTAIFQTRALAAEDAARATLARGEQMLKAV